MWVLIIPNSNWQNQNHVISVSHSPSNDRWLVVYFIRRVLAPPKFASCFTDQTNYVIAPKSTALFCISWH